MPPSVKVLAVMFTLRFVPSVTAPVPKVSDLVPTNVKLPFHVWALLLINVIAAALVLSNAPPLIVNVPVPIAVALFISSWPTRGSFHRCKYYFPKMPKFPAPYLVSANASILRTHSEHVAGPRHVAIGAQRHSACPKIQRLSSDECEIAAPCLCIIVR